MTSVPQEEDALSQLSSAVAQLAETSLRCPTSAAEPTQRLGHAYSAAELDVIRQRLVSQKLQIDSALKAGQDVEELPEDTEDCTEMINGLAQDLVKVTSKNSIKELLLKRLQLGIELEKNLFETSQPGAGGDFTNPTQSLSSLAKKQASLVSEILANDSENERLNTELIELQKQNSEIKKSNRDLMTQVHDLRKDQIEAAQQIDYTAIQRSEKTLEEITAKIVLQRHTLQALVVGSGVNWAADTELRDMVINLGEPLDL